MTSLIKIRFLIVLLIDFLLGAIAINLSSFIRLGESFVYFTETLIAAFLVPSTFYFFKIYKSSWRYFSLLDMWSLIRICLIANIFIFISIFIFNRLELIPRLVIVFNFFTLSICTCSSRIVYRSLFERFSKDVRIKNKDYISVLLVGSEENADSFIRGTERKNSAYKAIGIISQNQISNKEYMIRGVPVLGTLEGFTSIIERLSKKNILPQRIVIVSNNIQSKDMAKLMKVSDNKGMKLGRAPAPSEILDNNDQSLIREVSLEDLLGRRQNRLNTKHISKLINNKVILITGAGGSIGSQLSKKISSLNPKKLIMLDLSENAIYNLKQSLEEQKNLNNNIFICSNIRNIVEIEKVFLNYRPDVIFHAAALKHVTICEENISEAIRTNVLATYSLANLAERFSCKCLVLISTDKAVEPTSVMGLTKRLAEIIIKSKDRYTKKTTRFITVRFGNVLGSSGSAIPLFQQQIKDGGPVTVTDPNIIRYFMSISEAAELVIQAGAMGKGGDVFVLDMGEPVKIYELAKRLINLSGYEVKDDENSGGDIEIIFTGLRPGEKLYEELLIGENVSKTIHKQIWRAEEDTLTIDEIEYFLELIIKAREKNDINALKQILKEAVLGFMPQKEIVDMIHLQKNHQ